MHRHISRNPPGSNDQGKSCNTGRQTLPSVLVKDASISQCISLMYINGGAIIAHEIRLSSQQSIFGDYNLCH